jgi:hypothetical protein
MITVIHKNNEYCLWICASRDPERVEESRSCADFISVINQLMEKQGI